MNAFHSGVARIRHLKPLLGRDLRIMPSGLLGYLANGKILDLDNDSNIEESCNQADGYSKMKKIAYCKCNAWKVSMVLCTKHLLEKGI